MPLLAPEPIVYPESLFDPTVESTNGRWWVLHTRPRAEKHLARVFRGRGESYFLPTYRREWRNQGRPFRSYLPLFPGYVFLHGDHQSRLAALETNLVALVLEVRDQQRLQFDLERVYRLITTGAPVTPDDRLEPGNPVQIIKGPLAGLTGTILKRGKQLRFVVEVEMLRRAVSAEVEGWMIQAHSA